MPIELGLWRIDQKLTEATFEPMAAESRLEDILQANVAFATPHLMIVGRQVRTGFDKVTDL